MTICLVHGKVGQAPQCPKRLGWRPLELEAARRHRSKMLLELSEVPRRLLQVGQRCRYLSISTAVLRAPGMLRGRCGSVVFRLSIDDRCFFPK